MVQAFCSVIKSCPALGNPMDCSTPGFHVPHRLQSLPKFMTIESVMPSNHLILCRPLLLLPSIPPSIRVFSNESALHIRWPKYWGFSFSVSPSSEYSGLVSFRMDWLDLLAVQGTLKSFSAPLFKSINSFALWLLGDPKIWLPTAACLPRRRGEGPGGFVPHSRGAQAREAGSRGRECLRRACVAT